MTSQEDDLWIFGYGSLVWRPAFESVENRPAIIRGWRRVFWQASVDHRGVPSAPGRVVTLIPAADQDCWGMAYRVAARDVAAVLDVLDYRERGGYDRHMEPLYFPSSAGTADAEALVYIATRENPNYAGEEAVEHIAEIIAQSEGPSGHNVEYALELAIALKGMEAEDDHVYAVAEAVRKRTAP